MVSPKTKVILTPGPKRACSPKTNFRIQYKQKLAIKQEFHVDTLWSDLTDRQVKRSASYQRHKCAVLQIGQKETEELVRNMIDPLVPSECAAAWETRIKDLFAVYRRSVRFESSPGQSACAEPVV